MKFHMLVFPGVCAMIDYADIFYFVNDLSRAYKRKKKRLLNQKTPKQGIAIC